MYKVVPAFIRFLDVVIINFHMHVLSQQQIYDSREETGWRLFFIIIENIESWATSLTTAPAPSLSKILVLCFLCQLVCALSGKLILILAYVRHD